MDVIGHDNIGMQPTETVHRHLPQLLRHQAGDFHLPKIERTASSGVQEPVQGDESFAGGERFAKEGALAGQASPQLLAII